MASISFWLLAAAVGVLMVYHGAHGGVTQHPRYRRRPMRADADTADGLTRVRRQLNLPDDPSANTGSIDDLIVLGPSDLSHKPAGGNQPSFGGGSQPSFGGGSQPSFGGGSQPSFGGGSQPFFGGGSQPFFGGGSQPSFGGGSQPSFGGGSQPSIGGGCLHFIACGRQPYFGGGSQPSFGGGSQPSFGGGSQPSFGGGSQPSFGGGSQPSFGGGSQPSFGGGSQPFFGGGSQPSFGGGRPVPQLEVPPEITRTFIPTHPRFQPSTEVITLGRVPQTTFSVTDIIASTTTILMVSTTTVTRFTILTSILTTGVAVNEVPSTVIHEGECRQPPVTYYVRIPADIATATVYGNKNSKRKSFINHEATPSISYVDSSSDLDNMVTRTRYREANSSNLDQVKLQASPLTTPRTRPTRAAPGVGYSAGFSREGQSAYASNIKATEPGHKNCT